MESAKLTNTHKSTIQIAKNGFTFFDPGNKIGVTSLSVAAVVNGAAAVVAYDQFKKTAAGLTASGPLGPTGLICRTEIRKAGALNAVIVTHTLLNPTARDIPVADVATGQFTPGAAVCLGPMHMYDGRLCHTDNVRVEKFPQSQAEYPYVRPLPVAPVHLGAGEDQPFSALYLCDRRYTVGLVLGAAAQDRTMQSWKFVRIAGGLGGPAGIFAQFQVCHEFTQASSMTVRAGGKIELDGTFYQIVTARHPQDAAVDYVDTIAKKFPFRGQTSPMLHTAMYCSWNYGRFADQYEDRLLKTAAFMAKNMPNIQFFLMDAGYQKHGKPGVGLANDHLHGFYPDPAANVERTKFPKGVRHYSDAIRKLGLRPGIWWSPMVNLDSPLAQDHPDWLARGQDGAILPIGRSTYLDLSVEPARQFVDRVLKTILKDWSMDALKMDFWSQSVESRSIRLALPGATALDTRKALFGMIRKYLPKDGVFMTCIAAGLGNPFIGLHADAYRNGVDVGDGKWLEQVHACEWALPTLFVEGRKTFLHNVDGVGYCDQGTDDENFTRLTWGHITMGMIEIDGFLENLPPRYVQALRKLTDRCDRGHRCLSADENAFTGVPLPECLYVNFPPASRTAQAGIRQSVALFNWSDEPRTVSVLRAKLGQSGPVQAENFWSGQKETLAGDFLTRVLRPHSSLLLDIMD